MSELFWDYLINGTTVVAGPGARLSGVPCVFLRGVQFAELGN